MKSASMLLGLILALSLSSCAFIKNNVKDIAGGAVAVKTAPVIYQAIVTWIDGDEIAMASLEQPAAFFKTGFDALTGNPSMPVVELAAKAPEYMDAIPAEWAKLNAAFDEYEARSGKPRPAMLNPWLEQGEQSYAIAIKAIKTNDRIQTACGVYASAAPIAALFLPIPLPSKIPTC